MRATRFLRRLLPELRSVRVVGEPDVSDTKRATLDADPAHGPTFVNVDAPITGVPYSCPCCGHRTLPSRGGYDLCPECDWEDDGQDDHDSAVERGGPNGTLSLDAARAAYRAAAGRPQEHVPPARP